MKQVLLLRLVSPLVGLVFGLVFWLVAALAYASDSAANDNRIVAIGDVHGALQSLTSLLEGAGLIDAGHHWIGGQATLVSLGDLVDRGPDSRAVISLLRELSTEAKQSSGQVVVLLGNHEVMNLTGDLRDLSAAEIESYGGRQAHAAAFSADGDTGGWLLTLPTLVQLDDTLFVHGGLSSLLQDRSADAINKQLSASLKNLLELGAQLRMSGVLPAGGDLLELARSPIQSDADLSPTQREQVKLFVRAGADVLLGEFGPLWYRGNASCHPMIESQRLQQTLHSFGVRRVVIGHTPTVTRKITKRLMDQVYAIDTGMLARVYRGRPFALEIRPSQLVAIDVEGNRTEIVDANLNHRASPSTLAAAAITKQLEELDEGWLVALGGSEQGVFQKMSKSNLNKELAALRIDQMLELQMVPEIVSRRWQDREGLLTRVVPVRTERQRLERNLYRPNYCDSGSDYGLLAAFDALIGKTDRGLDDLVYRRSDWGMVAANNKTAFATSARLPKYATQPKLHSALADLLIGLDRTLLEKELGDLLSPRQISAILKRRDKILEWPRVQ